MIHFLGGSSEADMIGLEKAINELSPLWLTRHLAIVQTAASPKQLHESLAPFLESDAELAVFKVQGPFKHQGAQVIPDELAHKIVWGDRIGDRMG